MSKTTLISPQELDLQLCKIIHVGIIVLLQNLAGC